MKIKCDGKEYALPDLNAGQYRKVLEADEKRESGEEHTLLSTEGVDLSIQFYYDLLNPHYPELTKKVLAKMPAYQLHPLFRARLAIEILTPPLDFVPEGEEAESVTGSSSTPAISRSRPDSVGRPKKSKS